jgi:hypothetical protein
MAPDFLGTLPGWITAVSTSGGMVTLIVAYWKRGVSLKSLDNTDHADIRDHYAAELSRVVERQHECERREAELRQRVSDLEDELKGLVRLIAQNSANKVLQLGEDIPSDIRAAAERVDNILKARQ